MKRLERGTSTSATESDAGLEEKYIGFRLEVNSTNEGRGGVRDSWEGNMGEEKSRRGGHLWP